MPWGIFRTCSMTQIVQKAGISAVEQPRRPDYSPREFVITATARMRPSGRTKSEQNTQQIIRDW
ncbi:MAG TPA: hypothetical protein DCL54_18530 [Alphaproteobacteria bacterium]|nr:hypothetical protein [Alphaproteobacteria bacterium]HAJ48579.1 hypothetical protein [Alphaproteobacteria bacterium]